jgi:hypothetical protein
MGAVPLIAAGTLISTVATLDSGMKQGDALEREARQQEKNARNAQIAKEYNINRQQKIAAQKFGDIRASYGASGVTESGSVLDVLRQSHTSAELDRLNILFGADMESESFNNRAAGARIGAGNARTVGTLSAFGTLFSGFGSASAKTASNSLSVDDGG